MDKDLIEFKEILAYGDAKNIEVGSPSVEGAKVEANLIENSIFGVLLGASLLSDSLLDGRILLFLVACLEKLDWLFKDCWDCILR